MKLGGYRGKKCGREHVRSWVNNARNPGGERQQGKKNKDQGYSISAYLGTWLYQLMILIKRGQP